jgi:hypothetical protein
MPLLSEMVGRGVTDLNGGRVGRFEDLIASTRGDLGMCQIAALAVKRGGPPWSPALFRRHASALSIVVSRRWITARPRRATCWTSGRGSDR